MQLDLGDVGDELCNFCPYTDYGDYKANTGPHNLCEGCDCGIAYDHYLDDYFCNEQEQMEQFMKTEFTKNIIFNGPATVIIWNDDTKTIVKQNKSDSYDREKGFLMAYFQKSTDMTKTEVSKFFGKLGE